MKKTKINKYLNRALRILIIVVAYSSLYYELFVTRDIFETGLGFSSVFNQFSSFLVLVIVLCLMFVNWSVEAKKWQFLIKKVEFVPYWLAFKAVLSGMTVSAFTPNRVGEYFGRVFILKKTAPIKGVIITVLGSISQTLITIIMGLIGVFFLITNWPIFPQFQGPIFIWIMLVLGACILFLVLFLYFNIGIVNYFIQRVLPTRFHHLITYFEPLQEYSNGELLSALIYSFVRYLVFSTQYVLLIQLFNIPLTLSESYLFASVVFITLTIIPSIALAELSIRGSVAIYVLTLLLGGAALVTPELATAIISAASLLWFINIVIPALTGAFFVGNLKFFKRRNK